MTDFIVEVKVADWNIRQELKSMPLTATGRAGSVVPRYFVMAFSMLTSVMYFQCPKIRFMVSKMSFPVNIRFTSGKISAGKLVLEIFYNTKRFLFEFQGKSLELSCSFPSLSAFQRISAVYCQLVPQLLNQLLQKTFYENLLFQLRDKADLSAICLFCGSFSF